MGEKTERNSKGPWILVGIILVLQIVGWFVFVSFAEKNKPESIPVGSHAVENSE